MEYDTNPVAQAHTCDLFYDPGPLTSLPTSRAVGVVHQAGPANFSVPVVQTMGVIAAPPAQHYPMTVQAAPMQLHAVPAQGQKGGQVPIAPAMVAPMPATHVNPGVRQAVPMALPGQQQGYIPTVHATVVQQPR
jgi:hypothetical protein